MGRAVGLECRVLGLCTPLLSPASSAPPYTPPTLWICLQVKARREEYEREREERDAKRIEDQRQREAELHGDWQEKEEEFHRIQSKRRCAFTRCLGVCYSARGWQAEDLKVWWCLGLSG